MRNGVRHLLGAGAGLLATPLLAAGLMYGHTQPPPGMVWLPAGALAGAALLIGVLAGSRLSPLASLVPGLAFAMLAATILMGFGRLIELFAAARGFVDPGVQASLLRTWPPAVGLVLLTASAFPSRWRGRAAVPQEPPPPQPEEEAPTPPPLPKRIPSRY